MKLTDLDIIVTAPPAPGWGGRYWILTKLTTASNGIVGWGEMLCLECRSKGDGSRHSRRL